MKQTNDSTARQALTLITLTALLAGCADYNSRPSRVEADFGNSVHDMVRAQTYDPSKIEHPNTEPVKSLDGKKGERVIEKVYRADIAEPKEVKQDIIFRIGSGSGGGQ